MSDLSTFAQDVKAAVDLRDLFAREGIECRRASAASSKCCCPHHQEKTPSCHVYADHYHCYGCQTSGDHIDLLHHLHRMEFTEALQHLAELAGMQMPSRDPEQVRLATERAARTKSLREVLEASAVWFRARLSASPEVVAYATDRGLTADDMTRWELGYAPADEGATKLWQQQQGITDRQMLDAGLYAVSTRGPRPYMYARFKGRLMFPIRDARGRMTGFSARVIADTAGNSAKYINTAETELFRKSELLYGLHLAGTAIQETGTAVLVEGQMDVIACHRAGVTNAVAGMGTAITPDHAALLRRYAAQRVVLAMDPDAAGQTAAQKALAVLAAAPVGEARR